MSILKYSAGIDISKNDFKVCISTIDTFQSVKVIATKTFPNTSSGIDEFALWANKHHKVKGLPLYFLMEATGVYHESLAWHLYNQDKNVIIVLANKAKKYLQSLGHKSKNDKIDAQGLAQMCCEQNLPVWKPISKTLYVLRSLTRLHEDLSVQRTELISRLHAAEYAMYELKSVKKINKKLIETIEKQLRQLEKDIAQTIEKDPVLKKKYEMIKVIKGVGLMTFAVIVAETDGFSLIQNSRQLMSYAGYDVIQNQSGSKFGKTRISKKGNSHVRRILHMPAFSVVAHDVYFKAFYERVYKNTGMKMKAYTAVQRKLLCLIYTLWKKEEKYEIKENIKIELSEIVG